MWASVRAVAIVWALSLATCAHAAADVLGSVDPFVGTASGAPDYGTGGGAGATFPGAVLPGGMVQFSPDTSPGADNFAGGYSYRDRVIHGFSLTHFSGAGCAGFGDIPILPTSAAVSSSPAASGSANVQPRYLAAYDHRHEHASPGRYSVTLDPGTRSPIRVQLTATARTGDAVIRFEGHRGGSILVNAGGSSLADSAAAIRVNPRSREIVGSVQSGNFCFQPTHYRVYFVAQFDRRFAASGTWNGSRLTGGGRRTTARNPHALALKGIPGRPPVLPGNPSTGVQAGAYATFHARSVTVRVGVSFTSLLEARRNLARESLGRSFAQLRSEASQRWRSVLGRVRVSGSALRLRLRSVFYTALYHALIEPSTLSDADGSYLGMDGRVHQAGRVPQYTDISGWDIYRTQVPLLAMLFPDRAEALATSLLRDARESGCLPRWPYANQQTNVMTGDPSALMLASIYAYGARRFDVRASLARMVADGTRPCHTANGDYTHREGLADYVRLGYIPLQDNTDVVGHTFGERSHAWGAAATTLEDALADNAIAHLALSLHEAVAARHFADRARNWKRLFDRGAGFIRPRLGSGGWLEPFDPLSETGFVEGDAAQYSWFAPQDPDQLVALMGGRAAVRPRLGRFFSELNAGPTAPYAFLGNEPTLGTPWLYDWLGQPMLAGEIAHRALRSLYAPTPGGMPGNDDGGTLSAWWVVAALGLYPEDPSSGVLAPSAPLFPHAWISLPAGTLAIDASGSARAVPLTLDARALTTPRISIARLIRGHHHIRFGSFRARATAVRAVASSSRDRSRPSR